MTGLLFLVATATTLPAARTHRDNVGCGTPTSLASVTALGPFGSNKRCTIFRLKDSE